jgi:hypothetical protein
MKKKLQFFLSPAIALLIILFASSRPANNIPASGAAFNIPLISNASDTAKKELITCLSRINRLENGDVEYNFNERQAPFTVSKTNPAFERILSIATKALEGNKPVKLIYTGYNTLEELLSPTPAETARYQEWQKNNIINPEPRRELNKFELDSAYFNYADWQKWKVFRLCVKTVPSFAVAKTIFNYCAAQGCYLGPTQVQPCIPFEYVRDGCFARAHKMRWIIETKYGYCSEKVFSYGNLDVKADKWGGCCVGWWYHVAPLIRVAGKGGRSLCYVIDPGMFNEPVLLSVWLAAQGNITCDGTSAVTGYSIQPSSAYTPTGGYNSQTYSTDPNYTLTNADLIFYNAQGNTCNN